MALVFAWRSRPQVDDQSRLAAAAQCLPSAVIQGVNATLARLVGDTGDVKPANLAFAQPDPPEVRWRTDGGASAGDLDDIPAFYASLRRGRLVILGEPGAGRTVLALKLLLDLATTARRERDRDPSWRVQVPVRMSLASLALPDALHTPSAVRDRVDTWISGYLTTTYGVRTTVAHRLVADG